MTPVTRRKPATVVRVGIPFFAAVVVLAVAPRWVAGCGAGQYFDGDLETTDSLARAVAADVMRDGTPEMSIAGTNAAGEWGLVSDQMAILGLGQLVRAHPELAARYVPVMEHAAQRMMQPRQRAFATRAWGDDALDRLGDDRGDAWIGWPALALAMLHLTHRSTPFAALDDRIAAALTRRLTRAPYALIETYPGQSFPTDVAACVAAIGLNARATGRDRSAFLASWAQTYRARWIDTASGYLWQQGDWRHGTGRNAPRGSGTAVAGYFLSFVDSGLTRQLVDALERHERSLVGFGAIEEYASGHSGSGDVDSGPVVLGVSITATGFALGAARAAHRRSLFVDLFRTTEWFGVPTTRDGRTRFAMGGRFGNAVMLAQLTAGAPPP